MKNIFECIPGLCEHPEHKLNVLWWILATIAIIYIAHKYIKSMAQ